MTHPGPTLTGEKENIMRDKNFCDTTSGNCDRNIRLTDEQWTELASTLTRRDRVAWWLGAWAYAGLFGMCVAAWSQLAVRTLFPL